MISTVRAFNLSDFFRLKVDFCWKHHNLKRKKQKQNLLHHQIGINFLGVVMEVSEMQVWWTSRRNLEKVIPMADPTWCQERIVISMIRRSQTANPNLWPFLRLGPSGMSPLSLQNLIHLRWLLNSKFFTKETLRKKCEWKSSDLKLNRSGAKKH